MEGDQLSLQIQDTPGGFQVRRAGDKPPFPDRAGTEESVPNSLRVLTLWHGGVEPLHFSLQPWPDACRSLAVSAVFRAGLAEDSQSPNSPRDSGEGPLPYLKSFCC